VAFSGTYYLYANGQYLDYATDFTYLQPGEIGYYVNAVSTNPFVSRYEELKIWKLEEEYYPPTAPPPAYPPVEAAPPTSGAPTVTATTYVNVRSGPGTNYPVLGAAPTGTTGEVAGISPDSGWYAVKVKTSLEPSGIAWVSVDYVTLSNPSNAAIPVIQPAPAPPPVTAPPPPSGSPTAIALEPVNVRSGPSTDYPSYGVAPYGATAPLVGKSQDGAWVVVTISTSIAPDGKGWVSAAYVQISGTTLADLPVVQPPAMPPDVVPPPPAAGSLVVQTTEPVNVRAGPGNEYPSYGKVPAGTPLQAVGISQDGGWVAVMAPVPSGIGWVSAAYLQPFDPSSLPTM
jgi:N-acetylmuramoyl-L-alanine amidase